VHGLQRSMPALSSPYMLPLFVSVLLPFLSLAHCCDHRCKLHDTSSCYMFLIVAVCPESPTRGHFLYACSQCDRTRCTHCATSQAEAKSIQCFNCLQSQCSACATAAFKQALTPRSRSGVDVGDPGSHSYVLCHVCRRWLCPTCRASMNAERIPISRQCSLCFLAVCMDCDKHTNKLPVVACRKCFGSFCGPCSALGIAQCPNSPLSSSEHECITCRKSPCRFVLCALLNWCMLESCN
jgi:hypothetical protein